jgi:serine phosphatase RsbU (regulator of sigma subunit)/anti-sigma regulatory factor (Ser/Thr protein kinase)
MRATRGRANREPTARDLGKKGLSPAAGRVQLRAMAGRQKITYESWAQMALPPNFEYIAPAVARFCDALAAEGATSEALHGLRLAVTEALTNSIKHGGTTPDAGGVQLRWMWRDEWLDVLVSEPGHYLPTEGWKELPADPLAESGRGGFLMAQATDELEHSNGAGRHTLRLRKRLGPPPLSLSTVATLESTLAEMTQDLSTSYETLSALFKLAEALATTEDLPAFAEHALQLRAVISADTMHLRFRDSRGQLQLLGASADGCHFPATLDPAGPSIEAEVFRTGIERTTGELLALDAADPLRELHGAAFVCPVYFQSRQLGVCVLGLRAPGAFFNTTQLSLARSCAQFLGIAYANADLQEQRRAQLRAQRELEIAAQIQQSLVPARFPVRPDWRMHGTCANALEAGGDFFDVLEAPGGLLLVIADVMGKGLPAALLAVIMRTAVRSHVDLAASPGRLLSEVSVQIAPDLARLGMFITAQVVFLEANSPRISYASAGHCPILAIAAGGATTRTFDEGGLPLGVAESERYSEYSETIAPDERIVLFTDGLIEAPDESGRQLGTDGLARAARDLHAADLGSMCARLLDFVHRRDAGRLPADDRTLLVAQRLP